MPYYRKRPIVIEAHQLTRDTCAHIAAWVGIPHHTWEPDECGAWPLYIPTLEGVMEARPGDWVIQGVRGEHYPCKPDVFAATYEPAPRTEGP